MFHAPGLFVGRLAIPSGLAGRGSAAEHHELRMAGERGRRILAAGPKDAGGLHQEAHIIGLYAVAAHDPLDDRLVQQLFERRLALIDHGAPLNLSASFADIGAPHDGAMSALWRMIDFWPARE